MKITKFETNYKRKLFLNKTNITPQKYSEKLENQIIQIYPQITYQSFLGFGGAFTEATGFSVNQLPNEKQSNLIKEYFSESGICYNFCRLPISSTDFSPKSYSYSNKPDLSDFSVKQDEKYIIPIIKLAQKENPNLKFLASPWSPPKFMKSNKMLVLGGKLLDKYKQTWADYISKYILEYKNYGINIEYVTVQNEPNAVQLWESCIYSAEEEIDFVINFLYPTFIKNNISTKILIWDHNKEKLFTRTNKELSSNSVLEAVSGIAFHYYSGDHFENIALTQNAFPGKLLIHTEGCTGFSKFNPNEEVKNAEIYAHDILGDLANGANAYIDWNLVLDNKGGPNHKKNFCNSPIMLNSDASDYIKNLSFYYIGHFSKFIKVGAQRIAHSRYSSDIEVVCFKNPDNSIVVILLNRNNFNKEYNLVVEDKVIHDNLDSHAIVSYLIN